MSELTDKIQALRERHPDWNQRTIAREAGCSQATVSVTLRGPSKRRWCGCGGPMGVRAARTGALRCQSCVARENEERSRQIVTMWRQGASVEEIASKLGMHRGSVRSAVTHLRKRGIEMPYRQIRVA